MNNLNSADALMSIVLMPIGTKTGVIAVNTFFGRRGQFIVKFNNQTFFPV